MSYSLNEQKILRIIKLYFDYIKSEDSTISDIMSSLFEDVDISQEDYNGFVDIIKNDKIQYSLSYSGITANMPAIVCIMDTEWQDEGKPLGDVINDNYSETNDLSGYIVSGQYEITIFAKQILLARMLSIFVKFALEHFYINSGDNDNSFFDMNIRTARFGPDAEYYPTNTFAVHLSIRFKYFETFSKTYSLISGIKFYTECYPNHFIGSGAVPTLTVPNGFYATPSIDIAQPYVDLTWNLVPDTNRYVIYWSTDGNFTKSLANKIDNITSNSYRHLVPVVNTKYYYAICSKGIVKSETPNIEIESNMSEKISATPTYTF